MPAVIAQRLHRDFSPGWIALLAIEQRARERVVAVCKGIGLDDRLLAQDPFDWKSPRVDLGRNPPDDDPAPLQAALLFSSSRLQRPVEIQRLLRDRGPAEVIDTAAPVALKPLRAADRARRH
jgi:hypothetical protein